MNYVMTFEQFSSEPETYPLRKTTKYRVFKTEFGDNYAVRMVPKSEKIENSQISFFELLFFINGDTESVSNKGNMSKVLNTVGKAMALELKYNSKTSVDSHYKIVYMDAIRKENYGKTVYKNQDTGEVSKRAIAYKRYFPKFLPEYKMLNIGDKIIFYLPEVDSEANLLMQIKTGSITTN